MFEVLRAFECRHQTAIGFAGFVALAVAVATTLFFGMVR